MYCIVLYDMIPDTLGLLWKLVSQFQIAKLFKEKNFVLGVWSEDTAPPIIYTCTQMGHGELGWSHGKDDSRSRDGKEVFKIRG